MIINEDKMQELILKEIREQVSGKLKQIGRDTIKDMYREVIGRQVREFLNEQQLDLMNEIKNEIEYEKEYWKKDVTKYVGDNLTRRLVDALSNSDNDYY